MAIITVWTKNNEVRLHQLSDDPADGTPAEQIAHLGEAVYAGYTCASENYTGAAPDTDPSLWRWNGSSITAAIPVPASVTPRQVRLLLLQQGLLDQVEAMIAQQDKATQIAWQYAEIFRRDDPLLNGLAQNLGLSSAQIDQFFIAAAAI